MKCERSLRARHSGLSGVSPAFPRPRPWYSDHRRGDRRKGEDRSGGGCHFPRRSGKAGVDKTLGQYFAALTNMRSVGVMGDFRTYDYAIVLRAVLTSDFMTADAAQFAVGCAFKGGKPDCQ